VARYNTLADGSSLVETDDGRQVRTALDSAALENSFGATLDPTLALNERASDITKRLDDVRAKYDPAYSASREESKKKAADTAGRLEIDQKAGELKDIVDDQRAQDYGGATAQNLAIKPLAPGETAPPISLTDAGGAAPFRVATEQEAAKAPPKPMMRGVQLVPDTSGAQGAPSMGSYAASQASGAQSADPFLQGLANVAAGQAVKRSRGSAGGWVPTSRSVAREEVAPPEFLEDIDKAEAGVEQVARSNAEESARRFNQQVVTPQLDQLEQNTAALEAAYKRRQAYDRELADKKKVAEDTERAAAEMKMPNVRDDYFDNNGGVFGRLLAGIAAGAGQWAAMRGGGQNAALGIINDNIKEHGQNLRDKYEQAKDNAKAKNNAYGQALAQYGDPETAMEALNLRGEAIFDRMLKVQMARHLNAGENAVLDQNIAQRKVDRAVRWADAAAKRAGRTVASESYARPTGGGQSIDLKALELAGKLHKDATSGSGNPEAWRQDSEAISRAVRLSPEDAQRLGTPVLFGTDKEEKSKAQAAIQATSKANNAIRRMREIYGTSNWEANPNLVADLEGNGAVIQALIANPLGLRQQTKEELEKISGPLVGLQGTQWGKLDSQAIKSLDIADRLFQQEKSEWMRTLLRDPYKPNFAEGDVETKPVRGAK
jgi:hypothetical protein